MAMIANHGVDLRRADWRFLLPGGLEHPLEHLVLLGAQDDLVGRILDAGIAGRVSRSLPTTSPADAVVVLHRGFDPSIIDEIVRCLKPDGVFYCEVDRRARRSMLWTPGMVERRLRRHGLTVNGLYWPLPGFSEGRRYVPLRTEGALNWYLSHLYGCGSAPQYLFDRGIRAVTANRGTRFSRLAPWYSLVASRKPDSLPSVFAHRDCPDWLPRPGLQPLLLTMGIDEGSRAVMLPFAKDERQPEAVVKVARVTAVNENVKSEQKALWEVRNRLAPDMRDTVPEPLGLFRYNGLSVGIERCARGRSISVSSGHFRTSPSAKLEDLSHAARWITTFNQQVQFGFSSRGTAVLKDQMNRVCTEYESVFGATPAIERMFAMVRDRVDSLSGLRLPIVWQHGDFGPWNVSRDGDHVTVIDWETRRGPFQDRLGPPLCDLIYFATYWSFVARRIYDVDAECAGFRDAFIDPAGTDVYVDAIHHAIGRYLRELEIDRRFVVPLLVFTWVRRALESIERDRVLNPLELSRGASNPFVAWIKLLADHIDRLFTTFEAVSHPETVPVG